MIKTKRSLYLVYENYPEYNLERYLKERGPIPALSSLFGYVEIRFAKIVCETLQEIHKKGYVYVNLIPSSIYVILGNNLSPASY
jgi:serine/threonine protein kinase